MKDLLRRLRRRDRSALEDLCRQYGSALTRAAYLYLGDSDAAADATQETLIAAWDGAGRTGEETRPRSWLFGILFNTCRKHRRTARRRRRREERAVSRRRAAENPGSRAGEEDRLTALQTALARLDGGHRAVVVLRYEQEMSVAETAAALGIPEGTVKSRTHTALARLKTLMERES